MGTKLQCLCSRSAATAVFTLLGCGLASLTKTQDAEWWGVSCCPNLMGLMGRILDLSRWQANRDSTVWTRCLRWTHFSLLFAPSWAQQVRTNCTRLPHVFFPNRALTVSLRFPLYLSGCKSSSSSSSVWCQQCWLIKAVGRQCVIHSYSWHMYYSRLNTYN